MEPAFRSLARSFLGIALLGAAACGPIRSGRLVADAAAEVTAADAAEAKKFAVYEYTAARAYLRKAREQAGRSQFEQAEDLARKSRDCARLARLLAEAGIRAELGAAAKVGTPNGLRCQPGTASDAPPPREPPVVMPVRTSTAGVKGVAR